MGDRRFLLGRAVLAGVMIVLFVAVQARGQDADRYVLRMEPAVIVDASGFERPLAAWTLFVPHGWRAEGGVLWGQEFLCTNGYNFLWTARSPDGRVSVAVLPQERWEWNNYGAPASTPGCPLQPVTNIRQYVEARLQREQPGARLLDYRVRADLQQELASLERVTPMPLGESRTWVEAGEVLFGYEEGGREMRGTLAAAAVFSLLRTNAGTGVMDALSVATFPLWMARAPNGQLDPPLSEAIRKSIRANPEWERRIGGHNVAIGRVALEESRKRSEIITRSNDEIARIRQEAWTTAQESADRRAREFGELLRGVETYGDADAAGGEVELSNLYDNAWRLSDGSYVLTNDSSFEPGRDLGVDGRRLDAVP